MVDIVTRTRQAKEDYDQLLGLINTTYSKLCALCGFNPNELEDESSPESVPESDAEISIQADVELSDSKEIAVIPKVEEHASSVVGISEVFEDGLSLAESCKMYAKKIAQMTHPDKLMKASAKDKVILLELFHQSKKDFADLNRAGLIYAYIHVRIIRGEAHKIDSRLFKYVEQEYQWVVARVQHLLKLPFINAVNAYCDGKIALAKQLFNVYMTHQKKAKDASR